MEKNCTTEGIEEEDILKRQEGDDYLTPIQKSTKIKTCDISIIIISFFWPNLKLKNERVVNTRNDDNFTI